MEHDHFREFANFLDGVGLPAEWSPYFQLEAEVDETPSLPIDESRAGLAPTPVRQTGPSRPGSPFSCWLPSAPGVSRISVQPTEKGIFSLFLYFPLKTDREERRKKRQEVHRICLRSEFPIQYLTYKKQLRVPIGDSKFLMTCARGFSLLLALSAMSFPLPSSSLLATRSLGTSRLSSRASIHTWPSSTTPGAQVTHHSSSCWPFPPSARSTASNAGTRSNSSTPETPS